MIIIFMNYMKITHFLKFSLGFVLLSLSFVFFSCKKDDPAPVVPEVDYGYEHLTALSVVLKGKLDVPEASVEEYGFQYENDRTGISTLVQAHYVDERNRYSLAIRNLEPDTQYAFRSFCRVDGEISYGEVFTFTTKELSTVVTTHSVSDLTGISVNLNGRLDDGLFYAYDAAVLEYGFKWGKSATSLDKKEVCDQLSVNAFSTSLFNLLPSTQYAFQAYFKVGSREFVGATITFTTEDATNLSSFESANCYVVSTSGGYKFKAVMGNDLSASLYDANQAEVLWESFGTSTAPSRGDIIRNLSYSDDYVNFTTPSPLKNGNAVIAVRDVAGNILWSWHIWVCDKYDPANHIQTYFNEAGKMMDRNLGATSDTPGDVRAFGLLYQWGRKDPFLGSCETSRAVSTLASWPLPVASDADNGTIAFAVAHPTSFIKYNDLNSDWFYSGTSSTDDSRWQSEKTIYDPCPPGWQVPAGGPNGVWATASNVASGYFSHPFDSTNKGMNFSGKFGSYNSVWYPAAGYLLGRDGGLTFVGSGGYWYSHTTADSFVYTLSLDGDGKVGPTRIDGRAHAMSVRCCRQ